MEDERQRLFTDQMRHMRIEEMTNILRCTLCAGLYRFAHTLIECGHTFCQQCIFAYIKGFKGRNPDVKCPQCHSSIEPVYQKSIMKDVFKQSLVDLLEPEYSQEEKIVISRIQHLFPEFNLSFLLDQFSFSSTLAPSQSEGSRIRRKKAQKSQIMTLLPAMVKDKLGLSFQVFTELILKQENYEIFLESISKREVQTQKFSMVIDLRPRTNRDFEYVGLNHKVRLHNLLVDNIKKIMVKKTIKRLQGNEEGIRQLLGFDLNKPQIIKIQLWIGSRQLEDDENLTNMGLPFETIVWYSVS